MATLIEAGFDQEEVNESLASFESLADEVFDSVVAAMKKKMAKMYKKEEEKPMAEVATPETFENVETTEASLVETVTQDETQTTRASIASWLENNILNKKK